MHSNQKHNNSAFKSGHIGFRCIFFIVNLFSKQDHAMHCGMINPHKLRVGIYAARVTDNNEYLTVFQGGKSSDKIGKTE